MPQNWTIEEWNVFRKFTDTANPQSLHPCDEDRWRDFVIASHKLKSQLERSDIVTALNGIGKFSDLAGELADRYVDERNLLERYDVARE